MFSIKLSETREQIQELNKKGQLNMDNVMHRAYDLVYNKHVNFGNRIEGKNGTLEEQCNGKMVEYVVMEFLGIEVPSNTNIDVDSKFDGGMDFVITNTNVDVKSKGSGCTMQFWYVHNLIKSQTTDAYKADYYIMCNLNKKANEIDVCGIIKKADLDVYSQFLHLKGEAFVNDAGHSKTMDQDTYWIPDYLVIDVKNLEHLKMLLDSSREFDFHKYYDKRLEAWSVFEENSRAMEKFQAASREVVKRRVIYSKR